jgi:hypothetical protein
VVARALLFFLAMRNSLSLIPILLLCACTGGDADTGDADTEVAGAAVYRDATTNHDGSAAAPAAPPAQDATITIVVEGSGEIPELDPQCALDPAGAFEAHFLGEMALSEDGAYLAAVGDGAAQIMTPSGCEIPDLTVGLITEVTIRAELEATTANCQSYCAASARADAEAECGASPSDAACRAEAETQAEAACTTTCTTQTDVIVAEVSLGASALGELDADALRAAALGELHADLVFDHAE